MQVARDNLGYNKLVLLVDVVVFALISWSISVGLYNIRFDVYMSQLGPALLVVSVSLYLLSAFEISLNVSLASLLSRNIISVAIALSILLIIIYLLGPGYGRNVYGRGVLLSTMIGFGIYLIFTRYFLFRFLRNRKPFHEWAFIGGEEAYDEIIKQAKALHRHSLVRQPEAWLNHNLGQDPEVGIILQEDIYVNNALSEQLIHAKFKGVKITGVDQFYENYLGKIPLFHVNENWFLNTAGFGYINDSIRQRVKRTIDLLLVVATVPITFALFIISSILIVIFDHHSPIYKQRRVGQHGRVFRIFKLRTMRANNQGEEGGWTEENDLRVTALGRILRRYRLDEIPQLFNVLRGNMSIIGPRPEQPSYTALLEQKIPYYDIRHSIKPGITGWAQVKFSYGASIEDSKAKLEYDLYYIKNYSLLLDLTILLKTIYTITSGTGR